MALAGLNPGSGHESTCLEGSKVRVAGEVIQDFDDDIMWEYGDGNLWDYRDSISGGYGDDVLEGCGDGVLWSSGDGILRGSGDDNRLGFCRGEALRFRDFRTHSRSEYLSA